MTMQQRWDLARWETAAQRALAWTLPQGGATERDEKRRKASAALARKGNGCAVTAVRLLQGFCLCTIGGLLLVMGPSDRKGGAGGGSKQGGHSREGRANARGEGRTREPKHWDSGLSRGGPPAGCGRSFGHVCWKGKVRGGTDRGYLATCRFPGGDATAWGACALYPDAWAEVPIPPSPLSWRRILTTDLFSLLVSPRTPLAFFALSCSWVGLGSLGGRRTPREGGQRLQAQLVVFSFSFGRIFLVSPLAGLGWLD